jgi:hypothetical protein
MILAVEETQNTIKHSFHIRRKRLSLNFILFKENKKGKIHCKSIETRGMLQILLLLLLLLLC